MSFDLFLYFVIVAQFVFNVALIVRTRHWRKLARAEFLGRRRLQLRMEFRTLDKEGQER